MVKEEPPLVPVDILVEVTVRGEDGNEEAQEGEGRLSRFRGRSRRIRVGTEVIDSIRGIGKG